MNNIADLEPKNTPYSASFDCSNKPCLNGPGEGIGYYALTLSPENACSDTAEAEYIAENANIYYEAGREQAGHEIQTALMIMGQRLSTPPKVPDFSVREITSDADKDTYYTVQPFLRTQDVHTFTDKTAAERFVRLGEIAYLQGKKDQLRYARTVLFQGVGAFEMSNLGK